MSVGTDCMPYWVAVTPYLSTSTLMMHPILEQVKAVLGDRIRIIKVDVDKYGVTANQYGIQSVPTLMLIRHGEVLWRTSGVMQKSELLATIDPFLK